MTTTTAPPSRLATAIAKAVAARRARRAPSARIACSPYLRGSWRAQRMLHRSRSRFRLLVCGRGVGKTHGCAYELIQLTIAAPPGSMGAVLAPTLTHAEAAIDKLKEIASVLPGYSDDWWVQSKRRLNLPGGRWIKVFSADRKETVRGPSIVALWIDEGAYVKEEAYTSSLPAIRRQGFQVQLIVSTTPAGKNWVYQRWEKAAEEGSRWERFRFSGIDSPYNDDEVIAESRDSMSPEKFAQEYYAEFVDNLLLAFPDRDRLFVNSHPDRDKRPRCWLGVDLGQKDFTVCTLMDEWGNGEVVDRWNDDTPGYPPAEFAAKTEARVIELLRKHHAVLVIDTGGAGLSLGKVIAEKAAKLKLEVAEVKTSTPGTKAAVVEQARADVQDGRITIKRNALSKVLDYELSKFQAIRCQKHGTEYMRYEGPQIRGEHDDCVISFCLANYGRAQDDHVEAKPIRLSSLRRSKGARRRTRGYTL
jgi:hypothetical protein